MRRRARGFSLLETLVALAIASGALTAFYAANGAAVALTLRVQREAETAAIARDVVAAVGAETSLAPGITSGTAADGSTWRLEIEPQDRVIVDGVPRTAEGLYRLRVTVRRPGLAATRSFTTLRLDSDFLR